MNQTEHENRRAYIRHPVYVPLNVIEDGAPDCDSSSVNISMGGLLFLHDKEIAPGTPVTITIPFAILKEPAILTAITIRSQKVEHGFEVAVSFEDKETALRARLVQQIVRIDDYRQSRGFEDFDAAADEWIRKYSENFPFD
jgi:hypothetical protein